VERHRSPAFDPTYDVVFPNGISYHTGGPDAGQPDRMDLLAQLIDMSMIKRLSPEQCQAFARACATMQRRIARCSRRWQV
jgi:hypothetical protein